MVIHIYELINIHILQICVLICREPIFVGMLLSKHADTGRYLFKFDCNGTVFEAFVTKKNDDSHKTYSGLKVT